MLKFIFSDVDVVILFLRYGCVGFVLKMIFLLEICVVGILSCNLFFW